MKIVSEKETQFIAKAASGLKTKARRLKDSEVKYRRLFEAAQDGILILNGDTGHIMDANPFVLDMLGYTRTELLGKRLWEIGAFRDIDASKISYTELQQNNYIRYDCLPLETKDKRLIDVEFVSNVYQVDGLRIIQCNIRDVSEHKKLDLLLRQNGERSEEKYRILFETMAQGVLYQDVNGKIMAANPAAEKILGLTIDQLIERTCIDPRWRSTHEDGTDFPGETHPAMVALQTGKPVMNISMGVFNSTEGRYRWILINAIPQFKPDEDRPYQVYTTFTDITERKKAEDKLLFTRFSLDNAADTMACVDREARFVDVNEAFCRTTGYSREALLSMRVNDIDPDYSAEMWPEFWKKLKQSGSLVFESFHHSKEGVIYPVEISATYFEHNGKEYHSAFARDITERKQAEDKLKKSEANYRAVIEAAADQIFVIDSEMKILSLNSFAAGFFHKNPEDMIGKSLTEIFPEQIAASTSANIRKVFETGTNTIIEDILTFGDKNMWNSTSLSPMKDLNGKVIAVIGIVRDITAGKQSEENLITSYQKTKKTLNDAINTMAKIVEMRDPYTAGHQQRVAELATAIAREIGCGDEQVNQIRMAATIHDIGKIYVPSDILSKPGKITDNEFNLIKSHAQGGYDIVKSMDFPCSIAQSILQHHELLDGSGYPNNLKGEEICLEARILSVSDVVEAMSSHRPYRPALGIDKALGEISQNKGKLYDPDVVDACVRLFKEKGFILTEK